MPRISLRTYENEIEELIEHNKLNEAIAHCRQILRFFPKNISTYRILGKAFLEGKQYKETADIFYRVLTVFPDDFIAHAGMSIVREIEKNLDGAIWHMQLAFDCQPSNIAIQEELKRLFDLRDGKHPEKIRLTRGALVRMYARGELFQQAIDEIKSALIEEPKRIDLQVFLAKMYFLSGEMDESLALCERIIIDLPYCYEVNRILVSILKSSGDSTKAQEFLNRLIELNPYQAYVNDIYSSEDQVPDEKVVIDKLENIPTSSSETEWFSSIQQDWQESKEKQVTPPPLETNPPIEIEPETLVNQVIPATEVKENEISQQEVPFMSASFENNIPSQESADDNIPDWMKSSGWVPSSNNEEQPPLGDNEASSETPQEEPEASPTEIPDWLKSLSQGQDLSQQAESDQNPLTEEPAESTSPAFTETNNWMNEIISENDSQKEQTENELPDWLKNFGAEGSDQPGAKDDLPDWLNTLKTEEKQIASDPNPFVDFSLDSSKNEQEETEVSEVKAKTGPISEEIEKEDANNLAEEEQTFSYENKPVESIWQPAEEQPAEEQPAAQPEPESTPPVEFGTDSTITKETEDDLLDWLRNLKPAEAPEETPTESVAKVPEEGVDEEQRYDFAVQLERLQQFNNQPEQAEETYPPSEAPIVETPVEPIGENVLDQQTLQETPFKVEEMTQEIESIGDETSAQPESVLIHEEEQTEFPQASTRDEAPTESSEEPLQTVHETTQIQLEESSISELLAETEKKPEDFLAWQNLGDAYVKKGDLVNALTAYNKAESLLINLK